MSENFKYSDPLNSMTIKTRIFVYYRLVAPPSGTCRAYMPSTNKNP